MGRRGGGRKFQEGGKEMFLSNQLGEFSLSSMAATNLAKGFLSNWGKTEIK